MAHGGGKTVCLLGIRADESLQRYSGILNKKYGYKDTCWISRQFKDVWCASPLYRLVFKRRMARQQPFRLRLQQAVRPVLYGRIKAGSERVASPFNDYAKDSLNLYRVIDPQIWVRLVGRVNGANFTAIYGRSKAMGYRNITLPEGHTWESYTRFLLATLPRPPAGKLRQKIQNLHTVLAQRRRRFR